MSVQELIDKYQKQIDEWSVKRKELFKANKTTEESILGTNSITLFKVIKDLKALGKMPEQSTDQALSLSDVSAMLLLKKYVEHVLSCEGVTFIDDLNRSHSDVKFTDQEKQILENIDNEL